MQSSMKYEIFAFDIVDSQKSDTGFQFLEMLSKKNEEKHKTKGMFIEFNNTSMQIPVELVKTRWINKY